MSTDNPCDKEFKGLPCADVTRRVCVRLLTDEFSQDALAIRHCVDGVPSSVETIYALDGVTPLVGYTAANMVECPQEIRVRPTATPFALRSQILLAAEGESQIGAGLLTFARASVANQFNAAGALVSVDVDTPRYDFHPVTHEPRGLLIEAEATNLFLNSATGATQTVSVAAVPHTISFYGTGTITLSGVHAHAVVGAGAFPARQSYTFTPTAGDLVCTVTGTVQKVQLETGVFASSWITTTGASDTRAADVVVIEGDDFNALGLTAPQWAAVLDYEKPSSDPLLAGESLFMITDSLDEKYYALFGNNNGLLICVKENPVSGEFASMFQLVDGAVEAGVHKVAFTGSNTDGISAVDGREFTLSQNSQFLFSKLRFGSYAGNNVNLWLRGFTVYTGAVPAAELIALTV